VSPLSVAPENGGTIALDSTVDEAPYDGASPALQWTTSGGGTFSDPHSTSTTFTCPGPGTVTVTLTAASPGCDQHSSATLTCN
jgi:hypothetical protein